MLRLQRRGCHVARPSAYDRARAYIDKSAPRAIQGSSGDKTTYAVACSLVIEFALDENSAWELMCHYNQTKCTPAWAEKDLVSKLRSAQRMAASKPGEVGKLLDQNSPKYTGPATSSAPSGSVPMSSGARIVPATQRAPIGKPVTTLPVRGKDRTDATDLFPVYSARRGAEPRTVRTLRTLAAHSFYTDTNSLPVCIKSKTLSEESGRKEEPKPVEVPPVPVAVPRKALEFSSVPEIVRSAAEANGLTLEGARRATAEGIVVEVASVTLRDWLTESAKESAAGFVCYVDNSTGITARIYADGRRKKISESRAV
jgi:hypothetical protein